MRKYILISILFLLTAPAAAEYSKDLSAALKAKNDDHKDCTIRFKSQHVRLKATRYSVGESLDSNVQIVADRETKAYYVVVGRTDNLRLGNAPRPEFITVNSWRQAKALACSLVADDN